ncbi:hypothetical protein G6F68_020154 [Rhizopus microsporus]|nr:hypothetical protein G6F68_020154 [Rhizopus microsporus]
MHDGKGRPRAAFFHPRRAWTGDSAPRRTEMAQRSTGQQMHVDVEHGLPGRLAAVHHEAVAGLGKTLAARVPGRGQCQLSDQVRL